MWSNYPDAWIKGSFSTYFVNTLVYTFTIVFGTLIIATLAAFPIARAHVRGSNAFYVLFLSGILLPAGIIPQFFVRLRAKRLFNLVDATNRRPQPLHFALVFRTDNLA